MGIFKNRKLKGKIAASILTAMLSVCAFGAESETAHNSVPAYTSLSLPPFFVFDSKDTVTGVNSGVRFIGPLGELTDYSDGRAVSGFRPLFTREAWDASYSTRSMDFVWPLSVWRSTPVEDYRWVLLYYGKEEFSGASRQYVIPIWFSGREELSSENGDKFYWGVFPIYGDVKNFMTYDHVRWGVFPVWWSAKRGGTYGEGYVWPIVNWDEGPNIDRYRVFPFYAYNLTKGQRLNRTYMWPFYSTIKSENEKVKGEGWFFFPLMGHRVWRGTDARTWIWPLFYYEKQEDGNGFRLNAPWPIFRYGKNMTSESDYILFFWPVWGKKVNTYADYRFYLWPIGWSYNEKLGDKTLKWLWILPLYWGKDEYSVPEKEDGAVVKLSVYRHFWPFFSYTEKGESVKMRALDVSPIRGYPVVERNLDPLWTLFRRDRNEKGSSWDLLWGIVRSRDEGKNGSFFAVSPFYEKAVSVQPGEAEKQTVERRYFFNIVNLKKTPDGAVRTRILWSIDF